MGADEYPVSGYGYPKAQVAQAMGGGDWLLHGLRRTAVAIIARYGVAPHVADKVVNHISGITIALSARRHSMRGGSL